MVKKPFAIFYIDANKAYFYGSTAASVLQIDVPADVVAYADVINRDKFYQLIQTFITTNKIEPAPLLILFSSYATYEKEVSGKLPDDINNDIQQFLDTIPYERILSRIYKLQDKIKVVGVNKDLYELIKHGFEKVHFPTIAVATLPLLQKMLPELGTTVNLEVVANKFDAIKQYSLITLEEINNPSGRARVQSSNTEKPNPLRLYGLIGVFVVLIGILVYVAMTSFAPPPKKVVATPVVHVRRVVTPTPTLTPAVQNPVSSPSGRLITTPQPQARAKSTTVIQ